MFLHRRQLHQIAVPLSPEVDAVRIHTQLQRTLGNPEIQQTDTGNIAGIGEWLKGSYARRASPWILLQSRNNPGNLVATAMFIVVETGSVTIGVTQRGH